MLSRLELHSLRLLVSVLVGDEGDDDGAEPASPQADEEHAQDKPGQTQPLIEAACRGRGGQDDAAKAVQRHAGEKSWVLAKVAVCYNGKEDWRGVVEDVEGPVYARCVGLAQAESSRRLSAVATRRMLHIVLYT